MNNPAQHTAERADPAISPEGLALRSLGTFTGLVGVTCAITILNLVWYNAEWTHETFGSKTYYHSHFPANAKALLLFVYIGGPMLAVLYRLLRLPRGLRIMPLMIGIAWLSQSFWWAKPALDRTTNPAEFIITCATLLFPVLIGLVFVLFFVRNPEGTEPTSTPARQP